MGKNRKFCAIRRSNHLPYVATIVEAVMMVFIILERLFFTWAGILFTSQMTLHPQSQAADIFPIRRHSKSLMVVPARKEKKTSIAEELRDADEGNT